MKCPAVLIGIDIGGTTTRAGLVDPDGGVSHLATRPTVRGEAGIIDGSVELVDEVLKASGHEFADVRLVGVGMPGLVDVHAGDVRHGVNVGLSESPFPMRDLLANRIGRPVWLTNDVNAAALGAADELTGSDARFAREGAIAYLGVGTGIAAGLIVDGKVWSGAHGAAGEIGHISIDPDGPYCRCGQRGCIEAISSGSAVTRKWPSESGSSISSLIAAAKSGDTDAVVIWDEVVDGLARAVDIISMTIDPDLIVLGGGIATHGGVVIPAMTRALRRHVEHSALLSSIDVADRLCHVRRVDHVGVVGAARAALDAIS
jgi:glucokinase